LIVKLAVILGIALAGLAAAEDAAPPAPVPVSPVFRGANGAPWLGLTVGRLDEAVRAQVPDLPQGIGFVVTGVDTGGPAEKAGVKLHDIFWKLGDQWIANESQLLTLLRLKKDGEEVQLGLYRTGEALSVPVMLGQLPPKPVAGLGEVPMKVLKPADRSAEIEAADGKAVLSLVNGQPEVKIVTLQGSVIYEGPVKDLKGESLVPVSWQPRVGALERALAHAAQGPRPPRTRVLPRVEEP
jgi:hypothetical protein